MKVDGAATTTPEDDQSPPARIRVSSTQLMFALPVFEKMTSGSWQESASPGFWLREIKVSDYDPDVFVLVLDVIHGHLRNVPEKIGIYLFTKATIVVNYYECHEAFTVMSGRWYDSLDPASINKYDKDAMLCMLISWVFRRQDDLKVMTNLNLNHGKVSVVVPSLPLPDEVLLLLTGNEAKPLAES
ncbi:hypothetical protein B0J13DRAFT_628462 [Dactylonectria estremocensis]|uniref:BTB domain-containing protein n=1 Tax=Dactylonectria estremocensis TaxID=1079267 RepID=A0A9P9DRL5_9HYPO|nr:hypothetical protein B0J13DRAFT_628462 [Dactylonectria estremocensis]